MKQYPKLSFLVGGQLAGRITISEKNHLILFNVTGSRGNGSTLPSGETDFQMTNLATGVCFQKEIVNVSYYGDLISSSGSFRLSKKVGRMVGGGKPKIEQTIHSSDISGSVGAREEGVRCRKEQHRRRERGYGLSRRIEHRVERNLPYRYSLLHYLIVMGISSTGLLFVCVRFLRDNGQPQSLPSQQIDVSVPTSSPTCGYYSYGACYIFRFGSSSILDSFFNQEVQTPLNLMIRVKSATSLSNAA